MCESLEPLDERRYNEDDDCGGHGTNEENPEENPVHTDGHLLPLVHHVRLVIISLIPRDDLLQRIQNVLVSPGV